LVLIHLFISFINLIPFKIEKENDRETELQKSSNFIDISDVVDVDNDDDDFVPSDKKPVHPFFATRTPPNSTNTKSKTPKVCKVPKVNNTLSKATLIAQREEGRRKRLLRSYKEFDEGSADNGHVLNLKRPPDDPELRLLPQISGNLKEHQLEAVRFMWTNIAGSVTMLRKERAEIEQVSTTPLSNSLSKQKSDRAYQGW